MVRKDFTPNRRGHRRRVGTDSQENTFPGGEPFVSILQTQIRDPMDRFDITLVILEIYPHKSVPPTEPPTPGLTCIHSGPDGLQQSTIRTGTARKGETYSNFLLWMISFSL